MARERERKGVGKGVFLAPPIIIPPFPFPSPFQGVKRKRKHFCFTYSMFLPAAKPSGPRTVRVVDVVVGGGTSLMTIPGYPVFLFSHSKFSSGWDPGLFDQISLRGGICD